MIIVDIREENGYLIVKYYAYTLVYCYAYFSEEENNGWYGHPWAASTPRLSRWKDL